MHRLLLLFVASVAMFAALPANAADCVAPRPAPATIRAWQSRKYGMFIHFGLYSTLGGVWKGKQYSGNYSEQIQSDAGIPEAEYAPLAAQFNPVKWDPDAVVQLARDAGMQFIVITSKHHDGFSMFHTHASPFNVAEATPYKRDIVKELADACARQHMPFGVYYSTIDWHFGDIPQHGNDNALSDEHEQFNVAQLRELLTGYGPISEIWFDMGHPTPLQSQHFADTVHGLQSECLISGRVWNSQGDFMEMGDDEIPEYILDEPWESPASIYGETWGYRSWLKRTDLAAKIREHTLRLVQVTSRGGNYILNIGPRGDGSIVEFEADVLRGAGEWLKRNREAVYDTQPQPFRKLDFGYATVKDNRLFLFVEHAPAGGRLNLPGLQNPIRKAYVLGDASQTTIALDDTPDHKAVLLPSSGLDGFLPVLALEFGGPLQVLQPAVTPGSDGNIELTAGKADRFYNANGEGYSDPPTLRKLQWDFAVDRSGVYRIEISHQPGKLSRLVDVTVGVSVFKANLNGGDKGPVNAGTIELQRSRDMRLSVSSAAPALRGAPLDVAPDRISLVYTGPAR